MKKKVDFTKKASKIDFTKKSGKASSSEVSNPEVDMDKVEFKKPDASSFEGMSGDVSADEIGMVSSATGNPGVASIELAGDKWYPGKRELTPREEAQKARDMKVEYSGVVPSAIYKALDEERAKNWIPPVEVEKMPEWRPPLTPLIEGVFDENFKEVALFMNEPGKGDREKVVAKLVGKVLKKEPARDKELVEKRIWAMLFDLQKEQGVSVKTKIFNQ